MNAPDVKAPRGDRPDLLTGALFVGIGALGLWAGRNLPFGTSAAMGAGYLPTIVCWLLVAVGLVIGGKSLGKTAVAVDPIRLRPLAIITVSVIGFAFIAERFGFVAASVFLVGVGSLADSESKLREVALLAIGLTAFGALVFIVGLGVQMKVWPF